MDTLREIIKRGVVAIKFSLLPILVVLYPIVFHYTNNVDNLGILPFSKLGDLFILLVGIAIVVYVFFSIANSGRVETAANAAFIFLLFFITYGIFFDWFLKQDLFVVEHYTFLPLFVLLGIYSSWLIAKLDAKRTIQFWNVTILILCGLILFNVIKIIPFEIRAARERGNSAATAVNTPKPTVHNNYPDIYFIIFDEYASFEVARQYFHYNEIDQFVEFLKSRGFFVAEKSRTEYPATLNAIATRLNYQTYPTDQGNQVYYEPLRNNKVMHFLKSLGYTTVLFNGENYAYSEKQLIAADFSYEPSGAVGNDGPLNDEFELLVADNTMILPFTEFFNKNLADPLADKNKNMIYFTRDNISKLNEVSSPKFIYAHLMTPHSPFLFDAEGNITNPTNYKNWDYYLGNYIYATDIAKQMVTSILASADPNHPPIIILQSDHGIRNGTTGYTNILENYPREYKYLIMNALYLPSCDTPDLKQDMKAMDTFPIIFNCYFDTNIPLQ